MSEGDDVGLADGELVIGARVGSLVGELEGDDVSGPPTFTASQTPLALHRPEQHSALAVHEVESALHAQTKALFKLQPVPAVQRSSISAPVHNRPPSYAPQMSTASSNVELL